MRLRVRYPKLGRVRFVCHRDGARLWERAPRRVGLPVAYTQSFTPRTKLSFGLALASVDSLDVRVLRTHQWISHDGDRREVLSLPADVCARDEVSSA